MVILFFMMAVYYSKNLFMMNPDFLVKILDNHLIPVNKVPALRLTFIRGLNAKMVLQFE